MHELQMLTAHLGPELVRSVESGRHIPTETQTDREGHERVQAADPSNDVGAREPVDVVHDQERTVGVLPVVQYADHVRVAQQARDARFLQEHPTKRVVLAQLGVDTFARVEAVEAPAIAQNQLDGPHPATLEIHHVDVVGRCLARRGGRKHPRPV